MNLAAKFRAPDSFRRNSESTPGLRSRALFWVAMAGVGLVTLAACAPQAQNATPPQTQSATTLPAQNTTAPRTQPATAPQTQAATAPLAPSGVELPGYKLVWSDEFSAVSWTEVSPKQSAKWLSTPSVGGKYIGFQVHDNESMVIKDGIMVNTLGFKSKVDFDGSRCAGPLGMKNDAGAELLSIEKLGEAKKGDKRLTWGGAGWVGMKFTTPAEGLTVSELGLYNIAGNNEEHELRIFDASTGDDVAKTIIKLKGQPAGWVYGAIIGGKKVLAGGHTYCLMVWQYSKNDKWYDGQTTVTATGGIKVAESEWGNWHAGSLFSIDRSGAGFMQQYGYWEARVKMPAGGVGLWPSWCLYTNNKSGLGEEVDIFEEYGGSYEKDKDGGFGMRNHNWGTGPKQGAVDVWPPVSKPWLNWHIYGFLATPTKCVYYVDGEKKAEFDTPTAYMNSPMYMTLEYNNGGGWPLTGLVANSHMDVDWLRVWALPEK